MSDRRFIKLFILLVITFIIGCSGTVAAERDPEKSVTAIFAGGGFRNLQLVFNNLYGVIDTTAGYTGGLSENPVYVNYAGAGHVEAVKVVYIPGHINYKDLLDMYIKNIDPTDSEGQFTDRGPQYRTIIYWNNEDQRTTAEKVINNLKQSAVFEKPIVTEVKKAGVFYRAEEIHQDYAKKHPAEYESYLAGTGRKEFFMKIWGDAFNQDFSAPPPVKDGEYKKPDKIILKHRLTDLQYHVTQENGTEYAYSNKYWDNHNQGIYVDVVSGEPLFSSLDKFDSGTGWPSFTMPLAPGNIVVRKDTSYGISRIEVRSLYADSHLGHVFKDGPAPTGLRYCINSAALRFIPLKDLEKEGYGYYLKYFSD